MNLSGLNLNNNRTLETAILLAWINERKNKAYFNKLK